MLHIAKKKESERVKKISEQIYYWIIDNYVFHKFKNNVIGNYLYIIDNYVLRKRVMSLH